MFFHRMAEDWEIIDNYWSIERAKFEQLLSEFPSPPEPEILAEWTKELHETEIWLNLARDRAKLIEHDQNELEVVASLQKEVKVLIGDRNFSYKLFLFSFISCYI